jgi:hypothetical protein
MDIQYPETGSQRQRPPEVGPSPGSVVPKKTIAAVAAIGLLASLVYSGMLSRGYESKTVRFANGARITQGSSFGPKRFFLRTGQTFVADYEVQVESGSLHIRLGKFFAPLDAPAKGQVRLERSGSGEFHMPIEETGVYQLWIQPWPDGPRGYDMVYTVSWGPQ